MLLDLQTLIDSGIVNFIIDKFEYINTSLGKKKVFQVIITYNHFDHKRESSIIKDYFVLLFMRLINSKMLISNFSMGWKSPLQIGKE